MKLSDITAAALATTATAGYTISQRLDNDTGEHILHVDGPNGWYAEVMKASQVTWLRKCITSNVAGAQNMDSAV